jgi:ferric-dicitrate binding protein FerR (iron transport regulator)
MASLSCKKFERLLDDYERGVLNEEDSISCDLHLGTCGNCRELLDNWRSFQLRSRTAEPAELPPLVERRMVVSALSGSREVPRKRLRPILVPVAAGVAVLIFVSLFILLNRDGEIQRDNSTVNPESKTPIAHGDMASVTAVPTRSLLEVNSDIRLWIRAGTEVRVERNDSKEGCFFLAHGHVVAEIDKQKQGYRFVVKTPQGQVQATGTVFSVEVDNNKKSVTRVLRGTVKVVENTTESGNQPTYSLNAGQSGVIGETGPIVADLEAIERDQCLISGCQPENNEMDVREEVALVKMAPGGKLEEASVKPRHKEQKKASQIEDTGEEDKVEPDTSHRSSPKKKNINVDKRIEQALGHRKKGEYRLAAEIYRELIDEYQNSQTTLSCHVSLGQLELEELGRPGVAATYFERYLEKAPKGFGSEEARLGLVKAYTKIGDQKAIITACLNYIENHSKGYASAQVLETLVLQHLRSNDCTSALDAGSKLDELWPNSIESRRSKESLQECIGQK